MTRTDIDALERAVEMCSAESAASRQRIDDRLAEGGNWFDVASSCAFHRQFASLSLLPWQSPPMYGDIDRPRRDQHAAELLQRMLDAGLSRYEPDPVAALERAKAEATKGFGGCPL
jgi:hypothetical protein